MEQSQNHENSVTIDQLAVMINNGFRGIEKRVDDLENWLDGRIDDLEKEMKFRFDGVQNQLDNIYLNFIPRREHNLLRERVRKVERKVGIISV